ncbi:MAG: DUF2723 domain-containing protein [Endomicrobiales bacterium]|nr:DUF2723 domain-containing protein [Endomicrobiales bacterium]
MIYWPLFLVYFVLYLFSLSPSISVGDSGELCASSVILGVAHSPGYPLFSLIGKAATVIVPFGNLAYRINILSALFGAASLVVIISSFMAALKFEKEKLGFSEAGVLLVASLFVGVSPAFWSSSVQSEVFTLNAFIAALLIRAVVAARYELAAFIFGIGLGNHHTLVFLSPLFIFAFSGAGSAFKKSAAMFFAFLLGFSVYFYLPVRSAKDPGLDWGNAETPANILRVIRRADYGSLSLTVGKKIERNVSNTFRQIIEFAASMNRQFTVLGIALGLFGIYAAVRKKHRFFNALVLIWFIAGPGFALLANMPFTAQTKGVMERFHVFTNLLWFFPVALGLNELARSRFGGMLLVPAGAVMLAAAVPVHNQVTMRNYYLAYDYGKNLLKTLAPGSVFFMDGGDDTFYSMAYLCFAEKRRQDVELHDRGGLVFKSVYGPDFRRIPPQLKEKRRNRVEMTYLGMRPLYYSTFNVEVMPGVKMVPDGVLYKPGSQKGPNTMEFYSLRGVFDGSYSDHRSRALVPIYPFFMELESGDKEKYRYWNFARLSWPEIGWLSNNLKVEMVQRGYRQLVAGRYDEAERTYDLLLEWFPDESSVLVNLGVINEKRGDAEAAKKLYLRAIELDPKMADAYYNLSVIFWREKNWEMVVKNLERLLDVNPKDERGRHFMPLAVENLSKTKGNVK